MPSVEIVSGVAFRPKRADLLAGVIINPSPSPSPPTDTGL
jgi:hypothetical protein